MRKREPIEHLIGAVSMGSSEYIEHTERAGQSELVNSDLLPLPFPNAAYLREHRPEEFKRQYDAGVAKFATVGIVYGEQDDDLFYHVTLPDGWTKKRTSHQMWSHVFDADGSERVAVFYKAAFYDRSAHCYLLPRFEVGWVDHDTKDHGTGVIDCRGGRKLLHSAVVMREDAIEHARKTYTYRSSPEIGEEMIELAASDLKRERERAWLDEHFPSWRDQLAYWRD